MLCTDGTKFSILNTAQHYYTAHWWVFSHFASKYKKGSVPWSSSLSLLRFLKGVRVTGECADCACDTNNTNTTPRNAIHRVFKKNLGLESIRTLRQSNSKIRWNAECPLILSIASLCFAIRIRDTFHRVLKVNESTKLERWTLTQLVVPYYLIASLCFAIRDQQNSTRGARVINKQGAKISLQEESSEGSRGMGRPRQRSGEHQHCEIRRTGAAAAE